MEPSKDQANNQRSTITDPRSEPPPDISVIIVTYNSAEQISKCLSSAIKEADNINQEIIVVDNDSKDKTIDIIERDFPSVRLFKTGENLGFAKACNFAAKQSLANHILLLNPDTVVLDRAVAKVLSFAKENPHYGLYGGRTLKEDGKTLERSSCWGEPSLWSTFCFATGLSTIFKHNALFDPESLGSWERDTIKEVGVITGCFLLASKEAWKKIDGFDEHFWLYGEDVDLSIRARQKGYSPVIYPNAAVIHEIGQSSTSTTKMIWLYSGKISIIKTHWRGLKKTLGISLTKTGVFIRTLKRTENNQWSHGWKNRHKWIHGHKKEPLKIPAK